MKMYSKSYLPLIAALWLLLSCYCLATVQAHDHTHEDVLVKTKPVTCGSSIKLRHKNTQSILSSQPVNIASPSGSGQQSVTAGREDGDLQAYWQVKEAFDAAPCQYGVPITCGATIRLSHVATPVNLHSHLFKAPISGRQEVTGFNKGQSNQDDNWVVECNTEYWTRESPVRFRHASTGSYLYVQRDAQFTHSNCPGCPFVGRFEVSAVKSKDSLSEWLADEGIYYSARPVDSTEDKAQKDEL